MLIEAVDSFLLSSSKLTLSSSITDAADAEKGSSKDDCYIKLLLLYLDAIIIGGDDGKPRCTPKVESSLESD